MPQQSENVKLPLTAMSYFLTLTAPKTFIL